MKLIEMNEHFGGYFIVEDEDGHNIPQSNISNKRCNNCGIRVYYSRVLKLCIYNHLNMVYTCEEYRLKKLIK